MNGSMGRSALFRRVFAVSLLAALHVPVALAGAAAPPPATADTLAEPPLDRMPSEPRPQVRDSLGLNFTTELLGADPATIELLVLVDPHGTARRVRIARGGTPFDSAAVDAVRWWLFDPVLANSTRVPAWTRVTVDARPPADADPVVPDVLALANDAEARGDSRGALDAWTGALADRGLAMLAAGDTLGANSLLKN